MDLPSLRLTPPDSIFGRRVFYGWWIVAAAFGLTSMISGFYFLGYSAFVNPLSDTFDVGVDRIGLVFGISSSVAAVFGLAAARLSPRLMTFAGVLMMGGGFLLVGRAESFLVYALIQTTLVATGGFMVVMYGSGSIINNWFAKRRGLAFAIGMTGVSFGAVLVNLTQFLIDKIGWQDATLILGGIVLAAGLPLAAIMRARPEDEGLLPDGDPPRPGVTAPAASAAPTSPAYAGFTLREALSTRAFWVMSAAFLARNFVTTGFGFCFIPAIEDKGFTAAAGASVLIVFAVMTVPSRLTSGYLGDLWRRNVVAGVMMAGIAASMLIMVWAETLAVIIIFLFIYGSFWGGIGGAMSMALRGEFFGRRNFAAIASVTTLVIGLGEIAGPTAAGAIFEETGSFQLAFAAFAIAALISAIGLLSLRPPASRESAFAPRGVKGIGQRTSAA